MKKRLCLAVALVCLVLLCTTAYANTDLDLFDLVGDTTVLENGDIQLTPCETWMSGSLWYKNASTFNNRFSVTFDYWAGGGRDDSYGGADGIVVSISENTGMGASGGSLGFVGEGAYGVEFDSYDGNSGDPDGKHIAIIQDSTTNHLCSVLDDRVDDSQWHSVSIQYFGTVLAVSVDGARVLTQENVTLGSCLYVGFSAATGSGYNEQKLRNISIAADPANWSSNDWAENELVYAEEMGLIPDVLVDADLTQSITRAEFAAVCVKVYESLAAAQALPSVINPFADCSDLEVLKAYNTGITNGTGADTFSPDLLLSRQEAATMLTRVFKRVTMPGWTLETDGQFSLDYPAIALFADDALIDHWAVNSVYFMAANGIVSGVGDNLFAPKNMTTQEEAVGYANATREQALIIAVRMVQNLAA